MKPNSFWQHAAANRPATYLPNSDIIIHHNFAALENDFDVSPAVIKALQTVCQLKLNHYPDRNAGKLKTKIASWLGIASDMVALGNGSDELISLIAQVFVEPKSRIVIQTPTFFRLIEAIHKMKGVVTPVTAPKERHFALDAEFANNIIATAEKKQASIIWLCTPNNPTGAVMNLALIERIAASTKALVVVDEAYQEIWDPQNKKSAITLIPKHDNILVTKTFSKAFGLAGIRVGMMLGNPNLISAIDAWRLNFPLSSISLLIAEAALEDTNHLNIIHKQVALERTFLFENIAKLPEFELGAESKTNVFILCHKTKNLHELLLKKGIMTADFNHMNGLEGERFVRITIKQHAENMALIMALEQCRREDLEK